MEKQNLDWLGWGILGFLVIYVLCIFAAQIVQDRTLRRTRTRLGRTVYTWRTLVGTVQTSTTHPALYNGRGGKGSISSDWADYSDGDGD